MPEGIIESGPTPQPEVINVGFNESDAAEEAAIEQAILDAEAKGTSIGELEDAKQKASPPDDPDKTKAESDEKDPKEGKPDNPETPAEDGAQPRDESGKFVAKDGKEASQFEKAKKEKERLSKGWSEFESECRNRGVEIEALNTGAKTWKDLERCKDFLRKQIAAATENDRKQIESERARLQNEARNRGQFSPQEYHKASQDFEKAGFDALAKAASSQDPDEWQKAVATARTAFNNAKVCANAAQKTWEYQLTQLRDKDVAETCQKYPELNDMNSEAGQAMLKLLKENPYLAQVPDGFSKAAKFLVAQREAARVSGLEGELKQAIADRDKAIAELKAATSLAGAGSQTPPARQNFDNMSHSEQEKAVESMFSPSGEFIHA